MPKVSHQPEAVEKLLAMQPAATAALSREIIRVIAAAHPQLGIHVKWNAPAFFFTGEMAPFDAKTYARDLLVFNLRQKGHVLLIFPTGNLINDVSGLLEGAYADGRRMVRIYSVDDLAGKAPDLQHLIRLWIEKVAQ
ncbi:DUF1801 domain-containing protein [Pedobacter sp. SYP-B3415]|uniref:DUF1801 domain-containing protein n=1 Tax=Pedobacter sp. SYP-B3415 TaxID=2496641 RepID=UPI00101DE926|nr:DUF1801 domain-containing protein [Pedobacter sp. SYP-B3415]